MTLYRSSYGIAEAGVLSASRRSLVQWVVVTMLPFWLLCGPGIWVTFIEPEVPPAFFWTAVAFCVALTIALTAMTPRQVMREGNAVVVRYCLGFSRTVDLSAFTRAVWMPQFRGNHHEFGLFVLVDAGRRRLRLDTRLFPAEDLMTLAAGTGCLEHVVAPVRAGQVRRNHPGVLPLRDSHPVLLLMFAATLAVMAVVGVLMLSGPVV
jgi:hypothetical protein